MSSPQNQDLVFHNDGSLTSDSVLNSLDSYLSIISHTQGTSPAWLLNSLIENALIGTASLVNTDLKKTIKRSHVYVISFLHLEDFFISNCKRNGLDLSLVPNFTFIDCFTNLFSDISTPQNASEQVKKLFDLKILPQIKQDQKNVILVEFPEFLLSSTSITSNELLGHLSKVNKACQQMYTVVSQDSQVVDLSASNPLDPVYKTTDFLVKLYHRSFININLKPLPTGRAKDITGCLTISRGTHPYNVGSLVVTEREYIYLVTKEGSVKLFFR